MIVYNVYIHAEYLLFLEIKAKSHIILDCLWHVFFGVHLYIRCFFLRYSLIITRFLFLSIHMYLFVNTRDDLISRADYVDYVVCQFLFFFMGFCCKVTIHLCAHWRKSYKWERWLSWHFRMTDNGCVWKHHNYQWNIETSFSLKDWPQ